MKALLEYHPRGAEKSKGKSSKGESRCFYMVRESGEEEDFSTIKCLDAVESNPPYVQQDAKKAGGGGAAAPGEAAKASKAGDPKKEEEKEEPKAEEKKKEPKAEEKKEEPKAE